MKDRICQCYECKFAIASEIKSLLQCLKNCSSGLVQNHVQQEFGCIFGKKLGTGIRSEDELV